jgi:hypothetical protein
VLEQAQARFGERFSGVLAQSRVWVNGQPAQPQTRVSGHDVVAVLPPVSGGSDPEGGRKTPQSPGSSPAVAAVGLLEREQTFPEPLQKAGPDAYLPPAAPPPTATPTAPPAPSAAPPSPASDPATSYVPSEPEPSGPPDPGWPDLAPFGGDVYMDWEPEMDAPGSDASRGRESPVALRGPESLPSWPEPNGLGLPDTVLVPQVPAPPPFQPEAPPPPPPRPHPRSPGATPIASPVQDLPKLEPDKESKKDGGGKADRAAGDEEAAPRRALARLAVVHDSKGPHGRLGLLWEAATIAAAIAGAEFLAGWLGVTAFVGACQAVGARRAQGHKPVTAVAALTAIAVPAAALLGVEVAAAVVAASLAVSAVAVIATSSQRLVRDCVETFAIGATLGVAAASPVLLRADHIEAAFLLLAYAAFYDAGAYLVGTGASSVWEGPVAGVAALIPVTILSAVLLVPPFQSGTPVALGFLAAALAPLGQLAGSAVAGGGDVHAPGLRRLDSLIILGPIWAAAAVAFST